jgi:hypothetical protein
MLERVRRELHQLPALSIRVGGEEHKVYRYRDVLNLAYQHGLVGFEQAAPIQSYRVPRINGGEVVVWVSEVYAVFRDSDGTEYRYHGVGDASVENANRRVAAAGPRLAHTRAKARPWRMPSISMPICARNSVAMRRTTAHHAMRSNRAARSVGPR